MANKSEWKGTASQALTDLGAENKDQTVFASGKWPRSSNKLRSFLEASQNDLKRKGIELEFDIFENGQRLMRFSKSSNFSPEPILIPGHDLNEANPEPTLDTDLNFETSTFIIPSDNDYAPNTDESPKPVFEDLGVTPDGKYWQMRNETGLIKLKIESKKQEDKPEEINEIDEKYMYQCVFPDKD
jgi:hypothetical protein